jgi:hypothetical protein
MSRSSALLRLLPALLLLTAPACDDAPQVTPEDMGVVLGVAPGSVCPEVGGTGEAFLDATVYARDGTAMEGVVVFFESDNEPRGSVSPEKGESDIRGLVRSTLTTPKEEGLITVTARVKGVGEDSAQLEAPMPGTLTGFPTPEDQSALDQAYYVNEVFDMFMILGDACHAREIDFVLTYDPTYVTYLETLREPTFLPLETVDVVANGAGGVVEVSVTIDPAGDTLGDFTGSSGFVRVRFVGAAETPTDPDLILSEFAAVSVQVQDRTGDFYRFEPRGQLLAVQILPEPVP